MIDALLVGSVWTTCFIILLAHKTYDNYFLFHEHSLGGLKKTLDTLTILFQGFIEGDRSGVL